MVKVENQLKLSQLLPNTFLSIAVVVEENRATADLMTTR